MIAYPGSTQEELDAYVEHFKRFRARGEAEEMLMSTLQATHEMIEAMLEYIIRQAPPKAIIDTGHLIDCRNKFNMMLKLYEYSISEPRIAKR